VDAADPGRVPTPSQTSGPLWGFALIFDGSAEVVDPDDDGAIPLEGSVFDGNGPLAWPDCFLEVWQGEQWARTRTDEEGRFRFVVRKPGPTPSPDGGPQAPHLNVTVFARGLLKPCSTRIYFPDEEEANAEDPVLQLVPAERRHTLVAYEADGVLRFDVYLQGEQETVFFAV
jgi:protocatechuate 3,4-dioxygenase, alpha subunit